MSSPAWSSRRYSPQQHEVADMSESGTLTVRCPVSGVPQRHILLLTGIDGYGSIYRCTDCQLTRLLPLPSAHEHLQNTEGMYRKQACEYDAYKASLAAHSVKGYLAKVHFIGHKPVTLVDLGGGLGYYSRAFADQGLSVTYVDTDPVSVEFARFYNQEKGVETISTSIEEFCVHKTKKFDVIFFRHVIEHCVHPDETLMLLHKISHPRGVLTVETDNNLSLEHLLHPCSAPYWRHVYHSHYNEKSFKNLRQIRPLAIDKDETHYYAFRAGNLTRLLERAGWQVEDCFDYSFGDPVYWPNMTHPLSKRFWYQKSVLGWYRAVIYSLLHPIFRMRRMGAGVAVYATPRD